MSASDNLNDVLFAGDEWEPLDTEHWRSVSIDVFWEIEDEDFREIRSQIVDRFREWLEWHKMHDENQVPESLGKLRPPTRNVLKALVPHYSETEDYYLDKVHVPDIAKFNKKESERWTYHARIPYWVQDNWLSKTTGNQWKVFCYIVRRCTFDPSHKHFGRCWLKYEVIRKRTGVQGVQSCAKALQQLGLIKATHVRRNYGDGVVTTNHFTVTFFAEMKKKGL